MTPKVESKSILDNPAILERAIIYARVSSDAQAEEGTSRERQIEDSLAYAEKHNLYVPPEFIFEEDYSGAELDRPELNKVRKLLQEGKADHLIIHKVNRQDRSWAGANYIIFLRELKDLGVSFHKSEVGRQVDLNDDTQVLLEVFEGWQAGKDYRDTVKKLHNGRLDRVRGNRNEEGHVVPNGAKAPYGYKIIWNDKDKRWYFEIEEDEARIIRMIFHWYIIGDETGQPLAIGAIASKLSGMKIPTQADKKPGYVKKQKLGEWHRSSISNILRNETYAGVWHWGKQNKDKNGKRIKGSQPSPIPVKVPAIVDRELWERAQEQLAHNKHFSKRNRKHEYLFSCRVKCGHCQYKMVGHMPKLPYYRCPGSSKILRFNHDCTLPYFRADVVDSKAWGKLEEIAQDKKQLIEGLRGYQAQQEDKVEPIRRELGYIEESIKDKTAEWEGAYLDQKLLTSERAKAKKAIEIDQIEQVLNELEQRKNILLEKLEEKTLTDEQIMGITILTDQVAQDIAKLKVLEAQGQDDPELKAAIFETKRRLIAILDIQLTLYVEDKKKKILMIAKFCPNGEIITIEDSITGTLRTNIHSKRECFIFECVIDLD